MERKIKVIGYPGVGGSRVYRMLQVFKYLNKTGKFECIVSPNTVTDEELLWSDIMFLHQTIDPKSISLAWAYQMERGKKLITDIDDTLEYEKSSPFFKRNKGYNSKDWMTELIKLSDLVTVTTSTLQTEIKNLNKNVHVIPNFLDMELWDKKRTENEGNIIRIGWSGSITHRDDLKMVMPAIHHILEKRDNVKFLYCGDNFIASLLKDISPEKHEYIQAIADPLQWPMLAHTLAYDIAIAPLQNKYFNRCKSYLKYLEYGITGAAGVYSPTVYNEVVKHGRNGFIADTVDEWEEYIGYLIDDVILRRKIQDNAHYNVLRNHSMEKNVDLWGKLYKLTFNS